jgi:hypothetical protein
LEVFDEEKCFSNLAEFDPVGRLFTDRVLFQTFQKFLKLLKGRVVIFITIAILAQRLLAENHLTQRHSQHEETCQPNTPKTVSANCQSAICFLTK